MQESERTTRKKRIDQKLKHLGWEIMPYKLGLNTAGFSNHAVEEYPTSNGPADYALFVDGRLLGLAEAKKLSVGAQNAIEQTKQGKIKFVDVHNRLIDVMDALQARWGSKITKNNFAPLIVNDNSIYKVTVEKKIPPKQSKGLGHLIIQRME